MQYKQFENVFMIHIRKGEEIVGTLMKWLKTNDIRLAKVSGIGASNDLTLGLFNTDTHEYESADYHGDYEITSILGNITCFDEEPYIHLHITIADDQNRAFGGHLNRAVVSGVCELIVETVDGRVGREFDPEVGLNVFKFDFRK